MKKMTYIILVLLLFSTKLLYSQIVEGKYIDSSNFIHLNNAEVEFRFSNLVGKGSYYLKRGKIIITPDPRYDGQTLSKYKFIRDSTLSNGEYIFQISWDGHVFSENYATGWYKVKEHPYVSRFGVDTTGVEKHIFKEMPTDSMIHIGSLFFNPIKIKLQDLEGGIFNITLKEGSLLYADEYFSELKNLKVEYEIRDDSLFLRTLFRDKFSRGPYYTFTLKKEAKR